MKQICIHTVGANVFIDNYFFLEKPSFILRISPMQCQWFHTSNQPCGCSERWNIFKLRPFYRFLLYKRKKNNRLNFKIPEFLTKNSLLPGYLVTLRPGLWWFISDSHMSQSYHETTDNGLHYCHTHRTHKNTRADMCHGDLEVTLHFFVTAGSFHVLCYRQFPFFLNVFIVRKAELLHIKKRELGHWHMI